MTGFAQIKGELTGPTAGSPPPSSSAMSPSASSAQGNGHLAFSLALKSVNHRFLDLHFRLPSGSDSLEMQLRRLLKEKIARGHVEVTLSLERGSGETLALNRPLISAYIAAFRAAAAEFGVPAEPDLNTILRIPGALDSASDPADGAIESAVMARGGRSARPPESDAGAGRTQHRAGTARAYGPPARSGQDRAGSPPHGAAELYGTPASAASGVAGFQCRPRTRDAGSCASGRPQRHSGGNRPPGKSCPAFSGTARPTWRSGERSWTSCCRK